MPSWMREVVKALGIMLSIAFVFAWFGVYDTTNMSFFPRLGFWFATMVIGGSASYVVLPWMLRGPFETWPTPIRIILAAAIISVPITLFLLIFFDNDPLVPYAIFIQFVYVFIVSFVLTVIGWSQNIWHSAETSEETVTDPKTRFLERLPVKYRTAELYALSSEDHYLRVHTSLGEELILMRLADALRELEGADGLQTHRSWWVAKAGVADAVREEGKLVLVLKSGGRASVSRTYAAAVKAAGLH